MGEKTRFFTRLTLRPRALAERFLEEGDRVRAAKAFERAGDHLRAARLAAEAGEAADAVLYATHAVLGPRAEPEEGTTPVRAAELLAAAGHHAEAIPLFELGRAFERAAESCLKIGDRQRAGRNYERARRWVRAADCYKRLGRRRDELRVLKQEMRRLESDGAARGDGELRRVEMRLAELLASTGERQAAATLAGRGKATATSARLLEDSGRLREAFAAYLDLRQPHDALRLAPRISGLEPTAHAEALRACGQHAEAARRFEAGGAFAEAAREYTAAGEPSAAAACFRRAAMPREAAAAHLAAGEHWKAAQCHLSAGSPEAATAALARVPRDHPDFERATLKLVALQIDAGALEEALQSVRRLPAEPGAGSLVAYDRLYWEARILEDIGRVEEAEGRFRRLVGLRPDHRDAAARLSRLTAERTRLERPGDSQAPTIVSRPQAQDASGAPFAEGFLLNDRYEIRSELGRGGMGRVYRAWDRTLGEEVAIKTLLGPAAGTDEARLLREVQICRRITHPNVVRVHDVGRFDGGLFVTMELLEGRPLDTLLAGGKGVPLDRVRSILLEVAAGLEAAHALGVVHRDLKPENVFLTDSRVKILDFGIARRVDLDPRLTRTGWAIGSPRYMSPEQIQGERIDARSDLYALGVLAYALIAGREPFQEETAAAMAFAHVSKPPPDIRRFAPELPAPWWGLLQQLLAKAPEDRPANAREVAASLRRLPLPGASDRPPEAP